MSNNKANRAERTHPMYGSIPYFRVSDLPASYSNGTDSGFASISIDTTSGALNIGARTVELEAVFTDTATTCTIDIQLVSDSSVVKSFTGVSTLTANSLFAGGQEGINLEGASIKLHAYNFTGTGKLVSLKVHKTS